MRYLIGLHSKPLRFPDLALISKRKAVGAHRFKSRVRNLELPPKLKAFVRADISPQIPERVFTPAYNNCIRCFDLIIVHIFSRIKSLCSGDFV